MPRMWCEQLGGPSLVSHHHWEGQTPAYWVPAVDSVWYCFRLVRVVYLGANRLGIHEILS